MNPESFEQVDVPVDVVDAHARFLEAGTRIPVEFVDGSPVSVVSPEFFEVAIADTAPPARGPADSTWKAARLANRVEVMAPQFIRSEDSIRLNLADMNYRDRAKARAG